MNYRSMTITNQYVKLKGAASVITALLPYLIILSIETGLFPTELTAAKVKFISLAYFC